MRLVNFLNESDYAQTLTLDQCKELLQKHCPKNLELAKKDKIIYRGDKKLDDMTFLDKSKRIPRESKSTSNHYTVLTSKILPEWKKFPRRDLGVICTTNYNKASDFGTVYKVIPFDGAKIGMCPANDFWVSFKWFRISGPASLNTIMNKLGVRDDKPSISNFMKQKIIGFKDNGYPLFLNILKLNALSLFTDVKLEGVDDNNIQQTIENWEHKILYANVTFGDLLEKMYDPTSNGFKLISSPQDIKPDKEVWFDDSAIMIDNKIKLDEF